MATQQSKRPANKKPVKKESQHSYEEEIRDRKTTRKVSSSKTASSKTTSSGRPAPKKKAAGKKKEKKKRGKILLFITEIFVLLIMVVILYGVLKTEKVGKYNLKEEDIVVNEEVKEKLETTMKGYRNIALFGVDSRDGSLNKNRSDTIMIASINQDTGECKLVSVYRDTYLNLSNDSYNKCNAAYAKGGPMQAINMLNMNLDIKIDDFVTVGFEGLADTIDALGGIEIDVMESEISHLNNYQISMVGTTTDNVHFTATAGVDYIPVTSAGLQTLNGLQATAYCRIRYVGDDFQRTQRQRTVLMQIAEKAKKASPSQLNEIANKVFQEIYTSLDLTEILELLGDITRYEIVDQGGFPAEGMVTTGTVGSKGSCVIPLSLEENVKWLHGFLFGDTAYEPSEAVKEYSDKVAADTNGYIKK